MCIRDRARGGAGFSAAAGGSGAETVPKLENPDSAGFGRGIWHCGLRRGCGAPLDPVSYTHLDVYKRQIQKASEQAGVEVRNDGNAEEALQKAATRLDVVYQVPFLAHACLEPVNCTVHVRKDACDIWVGIQVPARAKTAAGELTGLPEEAVQVHNHLIGGGFGRRLEIDFVIHAVKIAKQVEYPVKVCLLYTSRCV